LCKQISLRSMIESQRQGAIVGRIKVETDISVVEAAPEIAINQGSTREREAQVQKDQDEEAG